MARITTRLWSCIAGIIVSTSCFAAPQAEPFYLQLKDTLVTEKTKKQDLQGSTAPTSTLNIKKPEADAKKKKGKVDLTLAPMTANEMTEMWCTILNETEQTCTTTGFLALKDLAKLNIIGGDLSVSIFKTLGIKTVFGSVDFAENFLAPQDIQETQSIIRYFVEHPKEFRKILKALEKIEAGQQVYLYYFKALDEAQTNLLESVYPWIGKKSMSCHTASLMSSATFQAFNLLFAPGTLTGTLKFFPFWGSEEQRKELREKNKLPQEKTFTFRQLFLPSSLWLDAWQSWYCSHDYSEPSDQEERDWYKNSKYFLYDDNSTPEERRAEFLIDQSFRSRPGFATKHITNKFGKVFVRALPIIGDMLYLFQNYGSFILNKQKNDIFNYFRARLIGCALMAEGLEEIIAIAEESGIPAFEKSVQEITELIDEKHSRSELGSLLNKLSTATFKGKPEYSFFSNQPRVLVTHKLMDEHKTDFIPALRQAGHIEVLARVANFVTTHQAGPAKACFIEFVKGQTPVLALKNFWNIFVPTDKVVLNSINIGPDGEKNLLFTGPNGGGKSTAMGAMAQAVALEIFGVAAAEQCRMTPFNSMVIYLHENEDISAGMSTFMAEKYKLDLLTRRLKSLKPNEKVFFFMDEGLTGTAEEETALLIADAVTNFAAAPQALSVIATHSKKPTEAAEATQGRFSNVYVEIEELASNLFKRTYKLVKGIPTWWFDDADKRHRFVEWLSAEAAAKMESAIPAAA